jgi:hypothetical protein
MHMDTMLIEEAADSLGVVRVVDGQVFSYRQTDLFVGLNWDNRPDMIHSLASEDLQRVWVATCMAFRELLGAVVQRQCLQLNAIAAPLLEQVLGEPIEPQAGFALFVTGNGSADSSDFGRRWCPAKWRSHLYRGANTEDGPAAADYHAWCETKSHVIDMSTFQIAPLMQESNETFPIKGSEGTFPPMIYWPKSSLPSHPREAWGDRKLLLWRKREALDIVLEAFSRLWPQLEPVVDRSFEIYEALKLGKTVEPAPSRLQKFITS